MTNTLDTDPVAATITRLYDQATAQVADRPPHRPDRPRTAPAGTAAERADAAQDRYMPVSPMAGRLMYSLIRATRPVTVVEFGMSYGISTLHLAAAVRDNGTGHVYTTELNAKKIETASATFADVGLDDVITVLDGDALETLATVEGEIGFVFMDGWKEIYLPVLKLLEPRLPTGALIVADNTESPDTADYLDRVRRPENGYTSVNFPGKGNDTMELSCRV
ncbi:O-methyltransferase [Gordonia hankookensis]|uniref:Class I SAM-dependent methyltransferase n=1 Tax=Gordonia hankookensis TaxID=589403 RepID=A0ABR7WJB5_9ACTN|nr:class I SAM-dependent methyltransferase [Gordonia hankookensis]MBD1322588.1 class I SAM-dependent methyltransferase [Gordonia hankookensis]